MFMHYKQRFPALARLWASYEQYQQQLELPARYLLLEEGKRAKYYYYIHKGAVRAFLNTPAGEDKTVQFFFEGDGLSSFESFMRGVPSAFSVETLEPAVITALPKAKVIALVEELKKEGVTIVDKMETYPYGKFIHILDAEGNKVQLWEAID